MQQHPGIGLGGFRKPPTSVDCCLRSQTNDPAMQAACHRQCNHCFRLQSTCGCQDRIAGSAGGSPGSRHCPSWVPCWLGPWWRSGRELCQPQTTWSSQQEPPWPSKPVLAPVLSANGSLVANPSQANETPQSRWENESCPRRDKIFSSCRAFR